MSTLKEKTAKLHIFLIRVMSGLITIISGVVGFIVGKRKSNNKYKVISILSILSGVTLLAKELETNFKPIDEEDDDESESFEGDS